MRRVFTLMGAILLTAGVFALAYSEEPERNTMGGGMMNQGGMMQYGHMMQGYGGTMMGMQGMGALTDSTVNTCNVVTQDLKQMGPQMMTGGQLGKNAMMGMTQNLKGMAENMKYMSQYMENLANNKEVMDNNEFSEQMQKMHDIMFQTSQNMHQMSGMAENLFDQMHKQKVQK